MPILPKLKVGLISCSGEEMAAGTIARLATLRVLEQLRPGETVTLCLPLFLAGNEKERAFARFYPTIAIDGCDRRCAARATEKYSAAPAASVVLSDFLTVQETVSRRQMDPANEPAVLQMAQVIAERVDKVLASRRGANNEQTPAEPLRENGAALCNCGSGIPVMHLTIAGRSVQVVALPLLFESFRAEGRPAAELMESVKVYNSVPGEIEREYADAVRDAFAAYCQGQ